MNFAFAFAFIALLQLAIAVPLPRVVTRVHTAEAVTTTKTYVTGTTTVWLPPVEILISDGVRYTITQYDGIWAEEQATVTSIFNNKNVNIGPFVAGVGEVTVADDATTTKDTTEAKVTVLATAPAEQPVSTPVATPVTTPADVSADESSSTGTDISTKTGYNGQITSDAPQTAHTTTEEPEDRPIDRSVEAPAETSTETSTETSPKALAEASADKSSQTSTDVPVNKPAETSASETVEPTDPSDPIHKTSATQELPNDKPSQTSSTTEATPETIAHEPANETTSSTTEATPETSSPEPAIATTTSTTEAVPETSSPEPAVETTPSTPATKTADPTEATSQPASAAPGFIQAPSGIAYSPYLNSGGCKGYDVIDSDLQLIKSKGISKIRLYGADCLVVDAVLPLCMKHGITVNQGFWISPAGVDSIDEYVLSVVSWAKINGWGVFDFFTVGNEAINNAWATVPELIAKIASVKSILNNAGYNGRIATSEPPISFIRNPSLCTESVIDIVGVNTHSYFNTNLFAYQAGEYVASQQAQVAQVCAKPTMTTETGYPHKGNTNGNNVPSSENQVIALQSIMESTGGDVTILTTFDDLWKTPGPYDIEQYFGMINLVQP